jgi:hypothetical protein
VVGLYNSVVAVGLIHPAVPIRHMSDIVDSDLSGRDILGCELVNSIAYTPEGARHVVDDDLAALPVLLPISDRLLIYAAHKAERNASK